MSSRFLFDDCKMISKQNMQNVKARDSALKTQLEPGEISVDVYNYKKENLSDIHDILNI